MCGIAGAVTLDGAPVHQSMLKAMADLLVHRGPDGEGYYCTGEAGLAHRRLSIIDLEGGAQPIHNEAQDVWVVFNGEIFNYPQLRRDLIAQGHAFYTQTDTEVLVHLYEQMGPRFVEVLNGQFAIALWDATRRRLILARDRVGIAPLYFRLHQGQLQFASEIKALLTTGEVPEVSAVGLDQLMTFWSTVGEETLFEGIHQLPPGQMLVLQDGRVERRTYWEWGFPADNQFDERAPELLAEELRELLVDATQIRLRADVPVGAYLSGGLDSSTLVALIRHHGASRLHTFSLGFEDESHDEGVFQQQMVRHLGTDHSRIGCAPQDIVDGFEQTIWHAETPILRTAPVPMRMLSGLARNAGFKVVLTGEGADEVFGGYDLFKEAKIRGFWARQPHSRWRPMLLQRLYPWLDISGKQGQAYLEAFFGRSLEVNRLVFSHLPRWSNTAQCKAFFSEGVRARLNVDAVATFESSLPAIMRGWHPFNRSQHIEARTLLCGYLLSSQGDRMLLANGVEGRFPFLDHRVIEFGARLHPNLKMKVLDEKHLLKRAVQGYLPGSILKRHKQPYRAPDAAVFAAVSRDWVEEMLSPARLHRYGLFDAERVRRLKEKVARGAPLSQKDNMAFVGILSGQVWYRLFVEGARELGSEPKFALA